jgi:hypothetical protein
MTTGYQIIELLQLFVTLHSSLKMRIKCLEPERGDKCRFILNLHHSETFE